MVSSMVDIVLHCPVERGDVIQNKKKDSLLPMVASRYKGCGEVVDALYYMIWGLVTLRVKQQGVLTHAICNLSQRVNQKS
jgi:hypothetical protein